MKKLITLKQLLSLRQQCQRQGATLVWTNGCFDFMHAGHVDYLQRAKKCGDLLVIGLNSDRSMKILKGATRPICSQQHRAQVLAALSVVDNIIIFDDSSPIEIIKKLQPDFYIKGGDYSIDSIDQNERRAVESYGGKIIILPEVKGISTSGIIQKIKKYY